VGEKMKCHFNFYAMSDTAEKGAFDSISKLKYIIGTVKLRWPAHVLLYCKVVCNATFRQPAVARSKLGVTP